MTSINRNKISKLERKELIVFDFDETLVDCNSDTWIHQLASEGRIPEELSYKKGQEWIDHVQAVLDYLHSLNVSKQDFIDCLSKMPQVAHMIDTLVKSLGEQKDKYDMIILSDANLFFISSYLESQGVSNLFKTILTNSSLFNHRGQLKIKGYHDQEFCPISARNLCKGKALKSFISEQMLHHNLVYTCINYVGDGQNDLCPSTKLSHQDRIFPRKNYPLDRLCSKLKMKDSGSSQSSDINEYHYVTANLKAAVHPWTNGRDILDIILSKNDVINNNNHFK